MLRTPRSARLLSLGETTISMTHLYIVRCNFTAPEHEAAWNAWYSGPKTRQMLAQPHFLSCQRFRKTSGHGRDYLALWVLASPEALRTAQYTSQWGFAEWERHVTAWSRDLFDAGACPPRDFAVPTGGALDVVAFDGASEAQARSTQSAIAAPGMMWLPIAGLDRHTPLIGLRVHNVMTTDIAQMPGTQRACYRPIYEFRAAKN
jgi:hypothetical protein